MAKGQVDHWVLGWWGVGGRILDVRGMSTVPSASIEGEPCACSVAASQQFALSG
jgi:hypothetical protein